MAVACSLRYTDPEEAVIWFDDTKVVFDHMGCPPCLWVRVASTEPVDFDREINPVRLSGRPFLRADIMGGVSRVLQTVLLSQARVDGCHPYVSIIEVWLMSSNDL